MLLLKWEFQKSKRSTSWQDAIWSARMDLQMIVDDSPSLVPILEAHLAQDYEAARKRAIKESGLPKTKLPAECPYTAQQILDEDFWPGPAA